MTNIPINNSEHNNKILKNFLIELAKLSHGTDMPIVNLPGSKFGGCNGQECPHINTFIFLINTTRQLLKENEDLKTDFNNYLTDKLKNEFK